MTRLVIVHPDAQTLAHATAARLITRLIDLQSQQESINLALTGGTIGIATLAAVAKNPACHAVDWSSVHLWWGDERFLPSGDPDRNETQAREVFIDALAHVNVHPVPQANSVHEAAELYAEQLPEHMDITLLGVGPDGHVASLFPGNPALRVAGRVVGVENSPKPPPKRVSLTFEAINDSREVWLIVSGAQKADALRDPSVPAAQVHGTDTTLLLADVAAVAE